MYFLDIRLVLFFSLLGRKEGRKKKKKKKRKQVQIDPSGPLLLMHGSEGSRDLFAGCVHKSYQSHHTDTKQQQHTGLVIYIRVYIYNILWGNQENDDPFGPPRIIGVCWAWWLAERAVAWSWLLQYYSLVSLIYLYVSRI
jgi:hypothetical protein